MFIDGSLADNPDIRLSVENAHLRPNSHMNRTISGQMPVLGRPQSRSRRFRISIRRRLRLPPEWIIELQTVVTAETKFCLAGLQLFTKSSPIPKLRRKRAFENASGSPAQGAVNTTSAMVFWYWREIRPQEFREKCFARAQTVALSTAVPRPCLAPPSYRRGHSPVFPGSISARQ